MQTCKRRGGPLSPQKRTDAKRTFLEIYAATHCILQSCRAAGINRNMFYLWKMNGTIKDEELWEAEEAYEQSIRDALQFYHTSLEYTSRRRLLYLAKAHLPEFQPHKIGDIKVNTSRWTQTEIIELKQLIAQTEKNVRTRQTRQSQ
jgi:hypothetical protein